MCCFSRLGSILNYFPCSWRRSFNNPHLGSLLEMNSSSLCLPEFLKFYFKILSSSLNDIFIHFLFLGWRFCSNILKILLYFLQFLLGSSCQSSCWSLVAIFCLWLLVSYFCLHRRHSYVNSIAYFSLFLLSEFRIFV